MVCLALTSFVQASSVATELYFGSTDASSLTINFGELVGVVITANSVSENSMNVRLDLLDDSGNVVANPPLIETYTPQDQYSSTITFGSNIYPAPGNYILRVSVTGASGAVASSQKSLEILPATGTGPSITSTPVTQIGEGAIYNYQLLTNPSFGLTYELTLAPSWLNIDSSGLISGIAPQVNANTQYQVGLRVSDGTSFATQTYSLYVIDATVNDITSPTIVITSPSTGDLVTGSEVVTFTDNELTLPECSVNNVDWVSCVSGLTTLNDIPGFTSLGDGAFTLYMRDTDNSGNLGTASVVGIVKETNSAPVITISSPLEGAVYDSHRTQLVFMVADTNLQDCWYSLDNGQTTQSVSCIAGFQKTVSGISSEEGSNTWIVYARDTTGQVGSTSVTFDVNLGVEELGGTSSKIEYTYQDTNTDNYLEQISTEKAPAIDLTEDMKSKQSAVGKFFRAIIDFFKRLFGF